MIHIPINCSSTKPRLKTNHFSETARSRPHIMAEAPCLTMAGERLEKLAREITCRSCDQHYRDPRVLPCCHYYCMECLRPHWAQEAATITCPSCKVVATGVESLEKLPPALVVNHLKMIHGRISKLEGEESLQCEMCLDPHATAFCKECDEFICSGCLAAHKKMRAKFQGHHTYSLEELKSGAKAFPNKHLPPCECPEHKELYKLYCFNCCRLICRDCIVIEHAQHHYEFVTKSVESTRSTLNANLIPLGKTLSHFTENAKLVAEAKEEVTNQGVFVARHVHERFTAMIELMKRREVELLRKTESVVKKKLARLNQQERELQRGIAAMMTVMDYVNSHLEVVSDEELLIIQHQLYTCIEEAMSAHGKLLPFSTEVPNLAVKIDFQDTLSKLCRDRAHVYLFPQHKKSHVHLAEKGKSTVQRVTDASRTATHSLTSTISAKLTSEVDGSVIEVEVFQGGKGLYELTYTPRVRGRHRLELAVDGVPIPDSPFAVFVTIPPEQLGPEPLYIISGLRHPYGAIFDQDHNLMVSESNGTQVCLLMRNTEGTISNKLAQFVDLGHVNPSGIASDREGNVYLTSASGHSLSKYDRTGCCLASRESQGSEPGELANPCGLGVIDDEVFVCDRNNCRVQVFDKDLSPLRSFGCQGREPGQLQWPYDLAQDTKGRVYVTDCDNHRVQVFDKAGQFLHTFGSRGSEKSKLKRPMGICLSQDGQHVYVSEYDNHRVSAYRRDGTFVSCFCHYGTKKGELCYPVGLAFDCDGFLYVCDQGNNRIQVF